MVEGLKNLRRGNNEDIFTEVTVLYLYELYPFNCDTKE